MAEIEVEFEGSEDDNANETEAERSEQYHFLILIQTFWLILRFAAARQRRQVLRLLANSELGRLFRFAGNDELMEQAGEDDGSETDDTRRPYRRTRRRPPDPGRFPKIPSEEGRELMKSGTFGSNEAQVFHSGDVSKGKQIARRVLDRELSTGGYAEQRINQRLLAQVQYSKLLCNTLLNIDTLGHAAVFSSGYDYTL